MQLSGVANELRKRDPVALLGTPVSAQGPVAARGPEPLVLAPLSNFIDVLGVDRELLAFDALGTKNFRARLELDEEVLWSDSQGRVARCSSATQLVSLFPWSRSRRSPSQSSEMILAGVLLP